MSLKGHPHALLIAKTTRACDLLDVPGRRFKQSLGGFEPEDFDGLCSVIIGERLAEIIGRHG